MKTWEGKWLISGHTTTGRAEAGIQSPWLRRWPFHVQHGSLQPNSPEKCLLHGVLNLYNEHNLSLKENTSWNEGWGTEARVQIITVLLCFYKSMETIPSEKQTNNLTGILNFHKCMFLARCLATFTHGNRLFSHSWTMSCQFSSLFWRLGSVTIKYFTVFKTVYLKEILF